MSYVTSDYFYNIYGGTVSNEEQLPALLERVSALVDGETLGQIGGIDALPSKQAELIRYAVCAETEFVDANGGLNWLNEAGRAYIHLGKFSTTSVGGENPLFSNSAKSFLNASGLNFRGVMV